MTKRIVLVGPELVPGSIKEKTRTAELSLDMWKHVKDYPCVQLNGVMYQRRTLGDELVYFSVDALNVEIFPWETE